MPSSATATSRLPGRSRSMRQPAPPTITAAEPPVARSDRRNAPRLVSPRKLATSPSRLPMKLPSSSAASSSRVAARSQPADTEGVNTRLATVTVASPARSASVRAPTKITPTTPVRSVSVRAPAASSTLPSASSPGQTASLRAPTTSSPGRNPVTSSSGRTLGAAVSLSANVTHPPPPGTSGLMRKTSVYDVSHDTRRYPPSSSRSIASNQGDGPPSPRTKPPSAHAHRRAKSGVTTLPGMTSLRPPSGGSASTSSSTSTVSAGTGTLRGTKPRAMSQHARAPPPVATLSSRTGLAIAQSLKKEVLVSSLASKKEMAPTSGATGTLRSRPAFNTLQQHYSPAKSAASKPATATFFAPPSPSKLPSNMAISAETSRHQNELLLLHFLHKESASTDIQWRESAREALGDRFKQLGVDRDELSTAEAEKADAVNVRALLAWGSGSDGELETKIQTLDAVLLGLWNMSETGGKYLRVVRRFERWADHMGEVEEARDRGNSDGMFRDGEVVMVGSLDNVWREEYMSLGRRLDEWRRQLLGLGSMNFGREDGCGNQKSSLECILMGCSTLIRDMLTELAVMEQIENEAIIREEEWVCGMLAETTETQEQQTGAIWRAF